MLKETKLISRYIHHYFSSINEHGVHSPYLFQLLTECIYSKDQGPAASDIESLRSNLKKNSSTINVKDLGAGSSVDGRANERTLSFITKQFSKSPKLCQLLYRLVKFHKPELMLELGTSMGLSTMYQAAGNPNGHLYTVEGCPETHLQAKKNIEEIGIQNITTINDSFDNLIPEFISKHGYPDWVYIDGNHTYEATIRYFNLLNDPKNPKQVLVFDDINWSDGMRQAWLEICSSKEVTMTLNLFYLGIVFFNRDFSKQDFKIRF
jgi:predicted O-methyltransferase YrrM